jgi:hypothetical protein
MSWRHGQHGASAAVNLFLLARVELANPESGGVAALKHRQISDIPSGCNAKAGGETTMQIF